MKSRRFPPALRTLGFAVLVLALLPRAASARDGGLSDAGTRWSDPLYEKCPAAPPPAQVDGGTWLLSPARASRNACLAVTCDERRRQLEAKPKPVAFTPVDLVLVIAGVIVGVGVGAWAGWSLGRWLPR